MESEMKKPTQAAPSEETSIDDRQLLEAIMLQLVQYRVACRRFNERRRTRGFDHRCSRLLDQIALRKSLLQLLGAEARRSGTSSS
jgi:hypothetical protein